MNDATGIHPRTFVVIRGACPLTMIAPPARNFLNASFVNVKTLRDIEGGPVFYDCLVQVEVDERPVAA